ncbi:hypothetical protein FGO68_gene8712 [Halteria grandinella]|uniref:Uncharacterized protein n=1 Tax=Halteria grandinella TaxID=5974 RepID=A0A8J8P0U7_HALGN|nr:hypothetical protein FGO68_gene8712 [Halteria grandinella]
MIIITIIGRTVILKIELRIMLGQCLQLKKQTQKRISLGKVIERMEDLKSLKISLKGCNAILWLRTLLPSLIIFIQSTMSSQFPFQCQTRSVFTMMSSLSKSIFCQQIIQCT